MNLTNADTGRSIAVNRPAVDRAVACLNGLALGEYLTIQQLADRIGAKMHALRPLVAHPPLCDMRIGGGRGVPAQYVSAATRAAWDEDQDREIA